MLDVNDGFSRLASGTNCVHISNSDGRVSIAETSILTCISFGTVLCGGLAIWACLVALILTDSSVQGSGIK